jgi:hypothetical protein
MTPASTRDSIRAHLSSLHTLFITTLRTSYSELVQILHNTSNDAQFALLSDQLKTALASDLLNILTRIDDIALSARNSADLYGSESKSILQKFDRFFAKLYFAKVQKELFFKRGKHALIKAYAETMANKLSQYLSLCIPQAAQTLAFNFPSNITIRNNYTHQLYFTQLFAYFHLPDMSVYVIE